MTIFLEGVGVVTQACTLVIALPALFLVLAARRAAPWVVTTSVLATALVMWAKAGAGFTWANDGWMVVPIAFAIGAAFGAAAVADERRPLAVAAGLIGGFIAGWMWQPCVGTELGDILNNAGTERLNTSARMIVYTAGALLPAILLAALPAAWPRTRRVLEHSRTRVFGLAFGVIYAVTVLSGRYDDLVGELSRLSSA